jgi:peptidoglycan/LPS O-acetylase OafA/YrhL
VNRTGKSWLLIPIVLLVLAAFVVPYAVLGGVDAWHGSFLFWTLATVAVIALNAIVSADWKD